MLSHITPEKHWKCLGCYHVKSVTLCIGVGHLVIQILVILLFITVVYVSPRNCRVASFHNISNNLLKTISEDSINSISFWNAMSIISFLATAVLIQGLKMKVPKLILPFLCLQVFNLLYDLIILLFSYLPSDVKYCVFIAQYHSSLERIPEYSVGQKTSSTIIYHLLSLMMYSIKIVYFCYRFLLVSRDSISK